jgi:sugar phosphate isomerase/epimerase
MQVEGEPLAHIRNGGEWLAHIHVADSERLAPGTGEYPYTEFAAELAAIGYAEGSWSGISVECRWRDFATEAPAAVDFLHQVWPRA